MSDGPYKSLKMRRCWRKMAKYADTETYNAADVAKCAERALYSDFDREIPRSILNKLNEIVNESQRYLFPDPSKEMHTTSALRDVSPSPMKNLLVEQVMRLLNQPVPRQEIMPRAMTSMLEIWAARHCIQVEEHYYSEGTIIKGYRIRRRLEDGIRKISFLNTAQRILSNQHKSEKRSAKKSGIDEGVPL